MGPDYEPTVLDPALAAYPRPGQPGHAVPSEPPSPEELRARFPTAGVRSALCHEAFLVDDVDSGDGIVLGASPAAQILYVDAVAAQSMDAWDGSEQKPFRSIAEALAHASAGTWILVAPGVYAEQLTIPGGVRLSGHRPAGTEPTSAVPVVTATAMTFAASAGSGEISMLENFEVHATLNILAGARVILEDNVLSPTLGPTFDAYSVDPNSGDTHLGLAVLATDAALRAKNNRIFVGSNDPENVNSQAFRLSGTCAVLTDNYLTDFRTPFALNESDVVVSFNVIDHGRNGFFVTKSRALISANYAKLANSQGCVYAMYMTQSRPEITDNQFYLQSSGTRGLNEADVESDPVKVVGNAFRLGARGTAIYLDRVGAGAEGLHLLTEIQDLNGLADVPEAVRNTLSVDSN
jgi:hypothetical protein